MRECVCEGERERDCYSALAWQLAEVNHKEGEEEEEKEEEEE